MRRNESVQPAVISPHTHRTPFLAAGAVTGIGSLPITSITSAIRLVAKFSPEVPFWPQLPQLSERESIVGQGLGVLGELIEPRDEGYGYQVKEGRLNSVLEVLHRSNGELTPTNAAGFGAFEEALSSGLFSSAVATKGQIEGPITLSACLFYKGRPFLSDPALFAAIAFHVSQIITWQIDRLKSAGLPVLLFVDEPALCLDAPVANAVSEEQRLNALAATLENARIHGAYAGLHCCAARPFERMCRVKPDIISFDAHEGLDLFFADWHALDFINQGGAVAYGIVPTRPGLDAVDSATIFIRWLKAASLAGDPQKFAQRAMITATCGLGLLDPSSVAESFSVAQSISKLIRSLAGRPEQ
ncbi:MAG: methionine synthase [Terriglobales bacterium]